MISMAVLTPFFDVVAGVAILAGRSSLLDRGVFKTANTNFTVRHLLALGFIGYGGWNLWKIERAQDKLKKTLDAESFGAEPELVGGPCEICDEDLFRDYDDSMGDVCLSCYYEERSKQDDEGSEYDGWLLNFAESFSADSRKHGGLKPQLEREPQGYWPGECLKCGLEDKDMDNVFSWSGNCKSCGTNESYGRYNQYIKKDAESFSADGDICDYCLSEECQCVPCKSCNEERIDGEMCSYCELCTIEDCCQCYDCPKCGVQVAFDEEVCDVGAGGCGHRLHHGAESFAAWSGRGYNPVKYEITNLDNGETMTINLDRNPYVGERNTYLRVQNLETGETDEAVVLHNTDVPRHSNGIPYYKEGSKEHDDWLKGIVWKVGFEDDDDDWDAESFGADSFDLETHSGHEVQWDDGSFYMTFKEPIDGYGEANGHWYGGERESPDEITLDVEPAWDEETDEEYDVPSLHIQVNQVEYYGIKNHNMSVSPDGVASPELLDAIQEGLAWMVADHADKTVVSREYRGESFGAEKKNEMELILADGGWEGSMVLSGDEDAIKYIIKQSAFIEGEPNPDIGMPEDWDMKGKEWLDQWFEDNDLETIAQETGWTITKVSSNAVFWGNRKGIIVADETWWGA